MQCIRVITKARQVTNTRETAEQDVDISVVGAHCAQQSASMAQAGRYHTARGNMRAWANMMSRAATTTEQNCKYDSLINDIAELDHCLEDAELDEVSMGIAGDNLGGNSSDEEEDDRVSAVGAMFGSKSAKSVTLTNARKSARSGNDTLSSKVRAFKRKGRKGYR